MARRIFKRSKEGVLVRLAPEEAEVLKSWLDQLEVLIDDPAVLGSDVAGRLTPAAHTDDPRAEDEYRQMTSMFMADERRQGVRSIRGILESGERDEGGVKAVVPFDDVEVWLTSVNYLRLALGTALGVAQDVDPSVSPEDPRFPLYAGYMQLSFLLEELLAAIDPSVMGDYEGKYDPNSLG